MRMIIVIILGLVLAAAMIGINNAYGEPFEDYITFPIPDNVKQTEIKKQITRMDDSVFEFQITYKFTADEVKKWYEENIKKYELTIPDCEFGYDEKTEKCLDKIILQESNFTPQKKPKDLIRYERDNIQFKTKLPTTKDQLDYSNQIKVQYLQECQRGINQMRGITEVSSFYTSEFDVDTTVPRASQITGPAGQLDLAIEECDAIREYLLDLLGDDRKGDDVRSRQSWYGDIQKHHSDFVFYDKEFWNIIPTHSTDSPVLTEHDFKVEELEALDRLCASDNVTDTFKLQQGCILSGEVGLLLDGTCRNYTVYNEDKTACLSIPVVKRTDGGIPLNSYVMDFFDRYDKFGDAEQLEKIQNKIRIEQDLQRIKIQMASNTR